MSAVVNHRNLEQALSGWMTTEKPVSLLLVGAQASAQRHFIHQFSRAKWAIREARSGCDALERLVEEASQIMLLDAKLPDLELAEFQHMIRAQHPDVNVIVLDSSLNTQSTQAAASMVMEARKPADVLRPTSQPVQLAQPETWHGMVGTSSAMRKVFRSAQLVARRDTTVLVQGESGTGKDLLARGIHLSSPRTKQPFVVINCAAIPETLLEAELFGYAKGSFTGAGQSRGGRIQAAQGGTLFLDEIGDMPVTLQSKLLRFLEQGEVQRIGETETIKVDCRVIAATNADLQNRMRSGNFREDLFYRLAVFPMQLPPLRDRVEDIVPLIARLLAHFCPGTRMAAEAIERLLGHGWPGNVRELRNVIERATLLADGRPEISAEDIVF